MKLIKRKQKQKIFTLGQKTTVTQVDGTVHRGVLVRVAGNGFILQTSHGSRVLNWKTIETILPE